MKARLVITNNATNKNVCRVFSVVNGEPHGGDGAPVSLLEARLRNEPDDERYHRLSALG